MLTIAQYPMAIYVLGKKTNIDNIKITITIKPIINNLIKLTQ